MNYLVSGGSKGLGEEICKKILLENESNIVITFSRNITDSVKEMKKKYKKRYFFYEFDLSCSNKIHDFVNKLTNLHGEINGLVNNAAVGSDGLLATMHESEIISSININITSQILLTKYISRKMLKQKAGSIVNISSIVSKTGYNGLSVYAFAKSGQIGFTKSLARELGKVGVRVNAVLPGFMETDMTSSIKDTDYKRILNRSPFKKLADVDDVADLVLYLISNKNNSITGECITIDYGSTS
jgi:3-oxoacyl-[acyl-carrier protein] reductase